MKSDVETILNPKALGFGEKIGDWFILHQIIKNLDTLTINEMIKQLLKDQGQILHNFLTYHWHHHKLRLDFDE